MEGLIEELAKQKAITFALQASYNVEKMLRLRTEDSLRELRRLHQSLACSCEMSEEFIVNKLICKIEKAKHEKEQMAKDIESEEECLTNNLQKKLRSIQQEKEQTESEVEDLKKRLDRMRFEQEKIARDVEAEQEFLSNSLLKKLQKSLNEKAELENQLCRSNSGRNSNCSSMNSSVNGQPDSPSIAGPGLFQKEMSSSLSYKKTTDSQFFSPRKRPLLSPGSSLTSNNFENVLM